MFRNSLKMLLTGGKSSRKNRSSDGGSEEPPDRRQSSVDSRQSRSGQGGISTESDCAFEPDYAVPPLPVSEGMQHIRIMEGMSRSLPSSPLLTHQSISVRLQPVKKLTGDVEQELGPPPSVDEAANTLMTRLGFLLGEKVTEVQPSDQYSMEVQDENQTSAITQRISPCSTLTSSTASPPASSPCSTLPPVSTNAAAKDCSYGAVTSPTSTLESRDSGIIATLTNYSENMERTKYVGEGSKELGSGGNLKPWQSQKSSMDSCLYRVDENMAASTYSLNKIPERNLETVLSQSVQSIPLYLMPRPNSVAATSSAHLEDLAYLDEQRHTPLRTSLRMPRQSLSGARTQQDLRVRFAPYRPPDISLKPLLFEVPSITTESVFVGRDWVFHEIDAQLQSSNASVNQGVVIVGNIGFGKTAIISRLVALSCHGTRMRQIASDSPHASPKHVDANRELPLTQAPSAHSSITSGSCPGTPEMRRRQEEAMRRLASQTILVGDSGVGKTSLLVQFDQGKFIPGSFSATVGIGFTVMLLGDSGVGKTCFLIQFKDGAFLSGTFIATVGIDFRNKVVTVDGARVKLQIWDTAGQERFRSVTHAYYRDAQALLLLYDITNQSSFDNIRAWLTEIHEYAQRDVVIMLLGNKADVSSERVIRSEDGETLAREYGVPFMETSAKTGMNVELAFLAIAKELKYRAGRQPDEPSFQIRDYVESQKKRSSCCSFV